MSETEIEGSSFRLAAWARVIVKYAVAISIAFSAVSFGMNWLLFAGWGISYSAAASPSDVLIGGLEVWGLFFPHLFIGGIACLAGKFVGEKYPKFVPYCVPLAALTGLCISVVSPEGIEQQSFSLNLITITGNMYLDYLILWGPFIFFTVTALYGKYPKLLFVVILFSFMIIGLNSLIYSIQNRSDRLVTFGDESRCTTVEYIVWVGSDRVLTSCSPPPYAPKDEFFIIEKDGLEMRIISSELEK